MEDGEFIDKGPGQSTLSFGLTTAAQLKEREIKPYANFVLLAVILISAFHIEE